MRFFAILILLMSCSAVSHAQDLTPHPAKIDDTAALDAAVSDIGKLSTRQTEALARALANCWDGLALSGTTDRALQECARSHRYFLYITEDDAPIRRMYDSWYIERVVKGTKRDKQRAATLNRIENAFSIAIIKRFGVLDQEHK